MALKYHAPRGTSDLVFPESEKVERLVEIACEACALYGYRRVSTPVLESTGLFRRSIGEETDIVTKEMYTFEDSGGESLTLRPEGTAPVVRAYLEAGLRSEGLPQKLYYAGPMFRRERPQAGRFRQFSQVGAEAIGSEDPLLDVEMISLSVAIFDDLGLQRYTLLLNTVGCRACRPAYLEDLTTFLGDVSGRLCDRCRERAKKNPLRVFDCKEERCRETLKNAPVILDAVCSGCGRHFEEVISGLERLGVPFSVDKHLVRGLDYYTRTTFEFKFRDIGAQDTVSAGGRYDYLVEELGGPDTPAVGFSMGVERLVMAMDAQGLDPFGRRRLDVFIAGAPGVDRGRLLELLSRVRSEGVSADTDYMDRGLKAQLKQANRLDARLVVLLGPDEMERGEAVFRDLEESRQWEVPLTEVPARALDFLGGR
ncbi:MAG: histidine--tRNA ligase [Actinobacteria bacterium]|nr:histidine--tRNA ligase [Actinomycetota bacterium]MCG2818699.1 histidine--tRNA ligase [Actinomycetes bacterium]MBU4179333.1 histidine--tRNA ligase [Actinomycetota bacterium]MBU4218595.1 histidine--tRNA ligase [Actinomycetota bacterium]MBU4359859.1 histidine--tRNA ligase [Actinomycetota bacterium]